MIDTFKKFEDSLPALLEDNNLSEVLAAIADHLDREAMKPAIEESSQHFKDLMLASDVLNAAAAGTNLDFGWVGTMSSVACRQQALRKFKKQAKTIDRYDYS